jgi:hypothetical protein
MSTSLCNVTGVPVVDISTEIIIAYPIMDLSYSVFVLIIPN